jgi:hypothetical protein
MSSRTVLRPYQVITNGNMASNITSEVTVLQSLSKISYDLSWSGSSPVGTASLQVSNTYSLDPNGNVDNVGDWQTVTTSSISGNTGTGFIDAITGAYATRVIYTATSGTGTLNATVAGKTS